MSKIKRLDINECKNIIKKLENDTLINLTKSLGLSRDFIFKNIKNNNLRLEYEKAKAKRNLPKFDFNYFEIIDTEEKAYWLGFLFADGCVIEKRKNSNFATALGLKISDKKHVEKFRSAIKSSKKITISKGKHRSCYLYVYSEKMFYDLYKLGCIPRKSLVLDWPIGVPNELMRHFIRGYFDGDGSICFSRGWKTSFVSSEIFLEKLSLYLHKELLLPHKNVIKISKDKKYGTISYSCYYDIAKLLDYMYKDCLIYLDRKFQLYKKFKTNKTDMKHKHRKDIYLNDVIELIKTKTLDDACRDFNISKACFLSRLKKENKYKDYQLAKKQRIESGFDSFEVIKMLANKTLIEVSKEIKICPYIIRKRLKRDGLYDEYMRIKKSKIISIDDDTIINACKGTSIRNASRKLNIYYGTLYQIIKKRKISI